MLPKSVSPWFVQLLTGLVAVPVALLGLFLLSFLGLRGDRYGGLLIGLAYLFGIAFLIPGILARLGIQVRRRSVERFAVAWRDRGDVGTDDLPIRICRGQWFVRMVLATYWLGGLVCLVLALCLVLTWFPPPGAEADAWELTIALLGMGSLMMASAFLMGRSLRRSKLPLLCEISEKGILAPDGSRGRLTFVPWEELARCEIIHDDETACYDHFVLWDRAGHRRFESRWTWQGRLSRSDRDRIIRALRARFSQKEKLVPGGHPVLAHQASSTVWDRELDG